MEKRKSVTALLTGFLEEANRNVVKPNYNSNMLMSVTGHTKHDIWPQPGRFRQLFKASNHRIPAPSNPKRKAKKL